MRHGECSDLETNRTEFTALAETGPIATVLLVIMLPSSLHVPLCGLLTVLQSIHCDLASIAVLAATK